MSESETQTRLGNVVSVGIRVDSLGIRVILQIEIDQLV